MRNRLPHTYQPTDNSQKIAMGMTKSNFGIPEKGFIFCSFNQSYKIDEKTFVIDDCIVVEIKAKKFITKNDFYQTKRYLISTNKELGLIVNFRDDFIKTKRVLNKCS